MEKPKVSVIIPVYNGEKYLNQCIDCLINQTLKDIEIICVNDGSTDSSLKILNDYACKDDRVKVISQVNINAGAARNNGMKYATGEYYSFLDADDFFETDMLEKSYEKAKAEDLDVVIFHSDKYLQDKDEYATDEYTIREERICKKRPFKAIENLNLYGTFVGWAWDKLFKADFVKKHGMKFQEQRTTNDLKFVYTMLSLAERIDVMDEIFVHQRKMSGSLSVTREKSWDCCYHGLLALREELVKFGIYKDFEQDFINYTVNFLYWNLQTLAWPTKERLFNCLKNEWFFELGTAEKDEAYFYEHNEYVILQQILHGSYSDMFGDSPIEENKKLKARIKELEEEIKQIKGNK